MLLKDGVPHIGMSISLKIKNFKFLYLYNSLMNIHPCAYEVMEFYGVSRQYFIFSIDMAWRMFVFFYVEGK